MKRSLQFGAAGTESEKHSGAAFALSGVLLIAATYGMARFGVGLLHPQMAAARPALDTALRGAGTAQFSSYCVAALIGGQLARRHAARVALAAGLIAAAGCVGLFFAQAPMSFIVAAFLAGGGAGLASPALVPLLDRAIPSAWSGVAHAAVNSGTAIGLIVSGALAFATSAASAPWVLIGAVCVVAGIAAWRLAPFVPDSQGLDSGSSSQTHETGGGIVTPLTWAALAGFVSAYVWTYGPSRLVSHETIAADNIGFLWVAVGVGGTLGLFASHLVARTSPRLAFLISAGGIVVATGGVTLTEQASIAIASLGLFGVSYMTLSSVLILWSRAIRPSDAGRVTAWLFLALALGQALGAAVMKP